MTLFTPLVENTLLKDRYEVRREIDRGGMGAVYEVWDHNLEAPMALKQVIRSEPELRTAFEREAKRLASLRHDALPRVIEHFSVGDAHFIVMEFIPGETLQMLLQQHGALPFAQVMQWGDELLKVLDYLHTRRPKVIHRDIKPQNIKLIETGTIVLLDFGIAQEAPSTTTSPHAGPRTIPGGTPHYASPEQLGRQGTGELSDIYSAAATLYHLLTNRLPEDANDRMVDVQNGRPDPLQPAHLINSGIPEQIGQLLHRAMSLRQMDRPQSARAFREELAQAVEAASATPPNAAPPTELGIADHRDGMESPRRPERAAEPPRRQERQDEPRASSRPPSARVPLRSGDGGQSLQKRIDTLVRSVLGSYEGAWMVWCDPRGDWTPLLRRVAGDARMGGF
ncbi:MAG TPA: protein kinase, partial [Herpetosiphonaceae bacterium]|nr:protein kinase [Herpetosiphonaceae bacterium]